MILGVDISNELQQTLTIIAAINNVHYRYMNYLHWRNTLEE